MKNLLGAILIVFTLAVFTPPAWSAPAAANTDAKVDLNKASIAELEQLPGIGAVTAKEIVAHRTTHGNFRNADDLLAVKGVGSRTLEKIRPLVTANE